MQKRCPECFEAIGSRTKKCPACGLMISNVKNEGFLPVGTVLNQRYYVGKLYKAEPAAAVYLGYDSKIDSRVFIREFTGECFYNKAASFKPIVPHGRIVERFINYVKRMASVSFCKLFPRTVELFLENGNGYAIYEYFEGQSLREIVDGGVKISRDNAVKIATQLCDELKMLHHSNMIYGVLSPDTLYISKDGSLHLFGLGSPFFDFVYDLDFRTELLDPAFAAPEQFVKGARCGAYSDVYSVAAVLYWLLIGSEPPIGFLRSKGETILIPHKVNRNIERSVSIAVLNGLNWQSSSRTGDLSLLKQELFDASVKRSFSPMIIAADALGAASHYYGKVKLSVEKYVKQYKNKKQK